MVSPVGILYESVNRLLCYTVTEANLCYRYWFALTHFVDTNFAQTQPELYVSESTPCG